MGKVHSKVKNSSIFKSNIATLDSNGKRLKFCPGCDCKLDGIIGLFKKTRKCEVCAHAFCLNCSYVVKK